jgi:Zn-dependent peptidase ImmA (M78 family)
VRDLLRLAAERDIEVHATHNLPTGWLGCWDPTPRRIWFHYDLTAAERRVVIAHELGHEFYGDECQDDGHDWRADHYAAALLIDVDEYARLVQIDPDIESLADAFRVTGDCIIDFQRYCLKQIGGRVYVKRPRTIERRVA